MLVERGVHLLENVFLDELARVGVCEAAFVCQPLTIAGADGLLAPTDCDLLKRQDRCRRAATGFRVERAVGWLK
jgi:hypothetical protein